MATNKHFNLKEGLDLEFFDTQSNYVDYLWEVLYRARNEARNEARNGTLS